MQERAKIRIIKINNTCYFSIFNNYIFWFDILMCNSFRQLILEIIFG